MIEGNDGGACVSFNGGQSWSTIYNQPTAQFYHVSADDQQPYRIYGAQQDNWAISMPSQSHRGAITTSDWVEPGGGESGYIAVSPATEHRLRRLHRHRAGMAGSSTTTTARGKSGSSPSGRRNRLGVPPAKDRYRFQWTFPVFSPRPRVLYVAGNLVFRSVDEGPAGRS